MFDDRSMKWEVRVKDDRRSPGRLRNREAEREAKRKAWAKEQQKKIEKELRERSETACKEHLE